MTETLEQQRDETAPVEAAAQLPADVAAPASSDSDLDALLTEFDAATAKPDADTVTGDNLSSDQVGQGTAAPDLDQQLQDLLGPDPRIKELEGVIGTLRSQETERQSRTDFESFAKKLQSDLGPNVDERFARTNLLSMAMENPALQAAWQHRHITNEQIAAADREFQRLEVLYAQAQAAPNDPRKLVALRQLEQRGQELGLMMNARTILNNVWRDVQKRASKVLPPIDQDQTDLHAEVAFAVRSASGKIAPEPPPNFGIMSDREFRDYTKRHFGF